MRCTNFKFGISFYSPPSDLHCMHLGVWFELSMNDLYFFFFFGSLC